MNFKKICVYDFETDGKDPHECNPVQLAAVIIDPRKLHIIDTFSSMIRPPTIEASDYVSVHKDTIDWHSKIRKCTPEQVIQSWKDAPQEKHVWDQYTRFLGNHHEDPKRLSSFNAPLPAGFNIINYDNIICERLVKRYGTKCLYNKLHKLDLMDHLFVWFENAEDVEKMNLDYLRTYFGMSTKGAHDALQDVKDTAAIIIKLLQMIRSISPKVKFKGSFK